MRWPIDPAGAGLVAHSDRILAANDEDVRAGRESGTTEALVEDRDDLRRILERIQDLPDDRREALIMRFALGMDNREIARAMGKTDGATKVLLHRAIKQLEGIVTPA